MGQTSPNGNDVSYSSGDLINASELREFVYCERAWWLSKEGYAVSAKAQEQRAVGVVFHIARAGAARKASNNRAVWWAIILILAAIALWLGKSFLGMGQ